MINLSFSLKHMKSDYRDNNYANVEDIEYIFGDIDDYYVPILTSSVFNKGYQRYHYRGDETRSMSVKSYLHKITPYLTLLIDDNRISEQKIELDIGFNMVHISDKHRITHFSRSYNIIYMLSSDTNKILDELLSSLYQNYQEDLAISLTSSSFVFESLEECNIHFHKIDLRHKASYIETPEWVKTKKAVFNPENENDVYCFMHAITIALYHNEMGNNVGRISKKLMEYVNRLNWHEIDFPVSYEDYVLFETLNPDVALNVLYVPFNKIK